jgi:hypothetical protein
MAIHSIIKHASLKLNHHLHSHYKKSLIERTMQY